ncbi:MAG: hypothetical protein ACI9PZ_000415 [Parvicella sp.]|jgi:hypothetical protein
MDLKSDQNNKIFLFISNFSRPSTVTTHGRADYYPEIIEMAAVSTLSVGKT